MSETANKVYGLTKNAIDDLRRMKARLNGLSGHGALLDGLPAIMPTNSTKHPWRVELSDSKTVKLVGSALNVILIGIDALIVSSDEELAAAEGTLTLHVYWDSEIQDWNYSLSIVSSSSESSSSDGSSSSSSSSSSSGAGDVIIYIEDCSSSSSSGNSSASSSSSSSHAFSSSLTWDFELTSIETDGDSFQLTSLKNDIAVCAGAYVRQQVVTSVEYDATQNALVQHLGLAAVIGGMK